MSFRNICCGTDFTIALVLQQAKSETGALYSWGNQEIMAKAPKAKMKVRKVPDILFGLGKGIKAVSCRYKMCMIIDESNRIRRWGKFFSKSDQAMKAEAVTMFKNKEVEPLKF
jgi:alpha-tubulin suppressor-like RCC1 family protein